MRHVIDFAIGGEPAVERVAVPGRQPGLLVVLVFLRIVDLAGHLVWLAELVAAAAVARFDSLVLTLGLAFPPYRVPKFLLGPFLTSTMALVA